MALKNVFIMGLMVLSIIDRISTEINLSPQASWDQNAITVAGWQNGTNGSSLSQLSGPIGISISNNDALYIADTGNHRIVVVQLGSINNISSIGTGLGPGIIQFNTPYDVFVMNTSLYVNDLGNIRMKKISLNGSDPVIVLSYNSILYTPLYIYVDNDNNIYLSDYANHRILLFHSNSTNFTVVAGITNSSGTNNSQLNTPYGLFVNDVGIIYIADCHNNRIMKWLPGASAGSLVAGNGLPGAGSTQLNSPTQIIVDTNEYMYISESGNGRITRWGPNSIFGECIAACTGTLGIASNQLNAPHSLAFDFDGSLYVSDWWNSRVQKFQIIPYNSPSYNQPKFSPCATWNPNAVTLTNTSTTGAQPYSVFVTTSNTIYVAEYTHRRVQVWLEGTTVPIKNFTGGLGNPYSVFVTDNGDVYVDNGYPNHRVDKWTSNATNSAIVMYVDTSCYGLFVDINQNIYCSIYSTHCVVKRSFGDDANVTSIVAGNTTAGAASNMLHGPAGIFVDTKFNLYVADLYNNRIQFFQSGVLNATTVAGTTAPGTITLSGPTGVVLDADGYLFIADSKNNRIVGEGPLGFRCIVGCTTLTGTASDHLNQPWTLSFDTDGNLYVADMNNNRIQKFLISTNFCPTAYNQPTFSPCATWNPNAVTFLDSTIIGLNPQGIFVNTDNTVYTVTQNLNYVFVTTEQGNTSIWNIPGSLNTTSSLVVTSDGDIYVDNGRYNHRVDKWISNTTSHVTIMNVTGSCWSLFIDINNNIYCSNDGQHQVVKVPLNGTSKAVITVAGNGTQGSESYLLSYPNGIFVDFNLNLYVADCGNDRIQEFYSGQLNGTTVAGNGSTNTITLSCPTGISLDADGYLFIVDSHNYRIVASGLYGFRCLVGCSSVPGSASNQLNNPQQISFDFYGNIFVADQSNNRVQQFFLATNSCIETSTNNIQSSVISTLTPTTTLQQILTSTITNIETSTNNIQSTVVSTLTPTTKLQQILTSIESSTNNIQSTVMSTFTLTTSHTTVIPHSVQPSSLSFVSKTCSNSTNIGIYCNVSDTLCDMLQPCQNDGTCNSTNANSADYVCLCLTGFNGTQCQFDYRLCKPNTCWNNGICNLTSNSEFICSCTIGWQGIYCQTKVNYCENVQCQNNGVCRSLLLNYTCECLDDNYSGRQCESKSNKIRIYEIITKSLAYIAILAMTTVAIFAVVMDVLKYWFGINPVDKDSKQKKQIEIPQTPVILRYIYVHSALPQTPKSGISILEETTV